MRINQPRKNNHKNTGFHYQKDRSTRKWREFEEKVMDYYAHVMLHNYFEIRWKQRKSGKYRKFDRIHIPSLQIAFRTIIQKWVSKHYSDFGDTYMYINYILSQFPLKYKLYWKKKLEIK